ncbi:NAD-dependent epimerase/dehydratase family protein [Bilophila wadsworthia]|uniref:NAD-dependent epimerase/dehydratase family protein n=1 Tax=Bilophila wadsworthia TaxID=35833 RepID=UPI003AB50577
MDDRSTEGESMRNLEGQRIVITGATGFIGRNVAEQLLAQGARAFRNLPPSGRFSFYTIKREHPYRMLPLL